MPRPRPRIPPETRKALQALHQPKTRTVTFPCRRLPGRRLTNATAWGFGIATEAAKAVLDWALAPDGASLDEVLAVTYPENVASQRVLEKIGMRRTGETDRFYGATTVLYSSVG